MLYAIAHFLRDKLPWIWDLIDVVNSWLFIMRFGGKLGKIEAEIFECYGKECGMRIVPMREVPTEELVAFFAAQPRRRLRSSSLMALMRRHCENCRGTAHFLLTSFLMAIALLHTASSAVFSWARVFEGVWWALTIEVADLAR